MLFWAVTDSPQLYYPQSTLAHNDIPVTKASYCGRRVDGYGRWRGWLVEMALSECHVDDKGTYVTNWIICNKLDSEDFQIL